MYSPYVMPYEPLKKECRHFLDCIRDGGVPESSGLDGLRVVQVLEAASASLESNGAKIDIQQDPFRAEPLRMAV
jgi:UDP-2-acetamido-3-amino-2,3-dideoxy-glucuronate N-acetyltransferase